MGQFSLFHYIDGKIIRLQQAPTDRKRIRMRCGKTDFWRAVPQRIDWQISREPTDLMFDTEATAFAVWLYSPTGTPKP